MYVMDDLVKLCWMQSSSSQNITFSFRYFQKCVKKEYPRFCSKKGQYTLDPNSEFEKKNDKNPVFSTENVAKMFINSLIDR
jgi:uncharacterized protein YifE (UPF0438 family)